MFPNFYDIKVIADLYFGMYRGSLSYLCDRLGVTREDETEHQAGSDSRITAKCFHELKKSIEGDIECCKGEIYGLTRQQQPLTTNQKQKIQQKSKFQATPHFDEDDAIEYEEFEPE